MNFAIWLKQVKKNMGRKIHRLYAISAVFKVNMMIKLPKKNNIHKAEAR